MEPKFCCNHCDKPFKRKTNLDNHIKVVHKNEVKKFICPLFPECKSAKCNGFFFPIGNLKVHYQSKHQNTQFDQIKNEVKCALVDKKCNCKYFIIILV